MSERPAKYGYECPECGHWQETLRERECVACGEAYVPATDYPEPSAEQLERMNNEDSGPVSLHQQQIEALRIRRGAP